ncbi:hypothetical protein HYC85_027426 [Camellia sinensis]|uniref:TFIID subunit TAF5 NTD2 domain-containing protein n=1 Tax=Camellia sinensis TaxID=4442 RepID=A0A7J7G6Q8_CAMSI|nr:hypothetical protein HYC85_027426 [Camellia sinensis]
MDGEEIEKAVIAYLKKKGFKQTELAFQEEQQHHTKNSSSNSSSSTDPDIAKHLLSFSEYFVVALDQIMFQHSTMMDTASLGHGLTVHWICTSFREDHETMHLRDLQKLEGVLSLCHLEEMEFAHSLRQSKVNLKICQLLEDSLEERLEKAGSLLSDLEKVDGESKEGNLDESKKRAVEGGKQGASLKKLKKDKVVGATGKAVRIETNTVPAAPRVKSELTLPYFTAVLGFVAVLCVKCSSLNCSSISHDGSLVAGGFSDSSLKVASVVLSFAMSPDGRYMASGDEDGTIMMWDLSSGRYVTPLVGLTSCVWTLAFR